MTQPVTFQGGDGLPMMRFDFLKKVPGIEVTWAGELPLVHGLCFGLEDGRLALSTLDGARVNVGKTPINKLGDAINSVAFAENSFAASSRSEVAILYPKKGEGGKDARAIFPSGAHGVITASTGHFVAAGGRSGLLVIEPSLAESTAVTLVRIPDEDFYYYKVAAAPGVIACAVRSRGVVATTFPPGGTGMVNSIEVPGLDVVDICPLNVPGFSNAFVTLGIDGTLMILPNVMEQLPPLVFKFRQVVGTAYRVLSTAGHIFVLTSKALYAMVGLADRYLRGGVIGKQRTLVRSTPLEGIDVNIAYNQYLLVVVPTDVFAIDIGEFGREPVKLKPETEQAPEIIDTEPSWDRYPGELEEKELGKLEEKELVASPG